MAILVTHSNHIYNDEKQRRKMQPYPPLQTLLACSVLRQEGFEVEFCDVTFENPQERLTQTIERLAPDLVFVCEDDFNFLTKMCLTRNRDVAFATARFAKNHHCQVAVHGSDSSDHADLYLDAGFDYVVRGEVEETIRELAMGVAPENICGLAYRHSSNGQTRFTPPRPLRASLADLPPPAWDVVDLNRYRKAWIKKHGFFSMNLISSRGCPYRCNWCAKPIYGNSYRVRPPVAVAEEMLYVKTRYDPDQIWFADDIFALSSRWTKDFADEVEKLGAQIPFKMQSRCDLMTRSTVADLKRAGCSEVWMGAESGSQRILDRMDKSVRTKQIYDACDNLNRHEIFTGLFLQFGYTGETWEDIEATIEMVRTVRPDDVGISVSYPLPGTKFYQLVASEMGQKANWSDSGDLTVMFKGSYSTEFYRAVAHAIHLEVRNPQVSTDITHAWAAVDALRETPSHLSSGVA